MVLCMDSMFQPGQHRPYYAFGMFFKGFKTVQGCKQGHI